MKTRFGAKKTIEKKTLNIKLPYKKRDLIIPTTYVDVDGTEKLIRTPFNEDDIPLEYRVITGIDDLYIPKDALTKQLEEICLKWGDKLPPSFINGFAFMEIKPDKKLTPKSVLFSKLIKGDYHSTTSKSDKNISSGIKMFRNNLPSFKKYKDDDNILWVVNNHRQLLIELLNYNYEKKNRITTIKTNLNAITRIFGIAYNKQHPLYNKYASLVRSISDYVNTDEGDNKLNENEEGRYIDWNYVLRERNILEDKFNNIKNKNTKDAYDINQDLILLSLYSLIAPLRNEPKTLKFTTKEEDKGDFVYFMENGETVLELNEIKKKHPYIRIPVGEHLSRLLKESYQLYRRVPLFTDVSKYPDFSTGVSQGTMTKRLQNIFLRKYGVSVGASILRSSYITWKFAQYQHTVNEKKEIAKLMRTSMEQLNLSYNKILSLPAINIEEVVNRQVPNKPIVSVAKPVVNVYKKIQENNKKYYKENAEKILARQKEYNSSLPEGTLYRRRLISRLNRDVVYRDKIKDTTIAKYDIKKDADGKYY